MYLSRRGGLYGTSEKTYPEHQYTELCGRCHERPRESGDWLCWKCREWVDSHHRCWNDDQRNIRC